MRNFLKIFIAAIAISFLVSSCKNKGGAGSMIPSDAPMVFYANTKSLLEKYPYDEFKNEQLFKDIKADSTLPEWAKIIFNDPKTSGIDLDKGITFFFAKGTSNNFNFILEGSVKDASNFEKLNKNLDSSQSVSDEKGLKTFSIHNKAIAVWNGNNFVYVFNLNSPSIGEFENQGTDSTTMPSIPFGDLNESKSYAIKLFSLKKDSSLAKDKRFNDLITEKGDLKIWTNTEGIMNLSPTMGMMSMLKLDALTKDNRSATNISFENGSIQGTSKTYYNKELMDLFKKYKPDDIKTDELSKIPSGDITGVAAINFKPELLSEILKITGLDGMVNMGASQLGLTLDDLIGAIDGHILFSFSDLKASFNAPQNIDSKPDINFNFLFKTGIRDQAKFKKIIDAINKLNGITNSSGIYYNSNDKTFALSNHKEFANSFLDGKQNNKADWMNKISGHSGGVYININKILSSVNTPSDSIASAILQKSKAVWNDAFATANGISDNAITGSFTVTFMDKNTNSLKILNSYIDQLYQLEKIRKQKEKAGITFAPPSDSTAIDNAIPAPDGK